MKRAVPTLVLAFVCAAPTRAQTPALGVESIGLNVSDLDRSVAFFRDVLDFELLGEEEHEGAAHEQLEGVFGLHTRVARLHRKLKALLKQLDCHDHLIPLQLFVGQRIPLAGVAHQNGTIRFGDDPRTSALDRDCKAHELDNLYVVDASFFPSSGAVNPALTIMANALRVGDRLLERLR